MNRIVRTTSPTRPSIFYSLYTTDSALYGPAFCDRSAEGVMATVIGIYEALGKRNAAGEKEKQTEEVRVFN